MRLLSALALVTAALPASAQVRGPFDAPLVIADDFKQIVRTLDLNGDGWMDAMGWWTDASYGLNPGHGFLHGWINDGAGNLVLAWDVPYVNSPYDPPDEPPATDMVGTGDIDGDGDDDFVIGVQAWARVYLSNGNQPPTLRVEGFLQSSIKTLVLADVDQNGSLEIVAADGALTIHDIDLQNQQLVLRSTIGTGFVAEGKLVVAELTGDGELDVLLSGVRVFPIQNGQLQPYVHHFVLTWGYNPEESRRYDAGDVDGDGDLDLIAFVVNGSGYARYRIVRRTGRGAWSPEPSRDGGPARMLVDVDADGDLDGVCCGGSGGTDPTRSQNTDPSAFRIALNDGTGTFASSIAIPSVGSKAIAGVADLDHDGDMDFVAGRCVLYAQGAITQHPMPIVGAGNQDRRTVVDLDADGDPDFEPTLQNVRRNRGDGLNETVPLGLPPGIPGSAREGAPFAGDWDGDGDEDLLVRLTGASGLELLRNLGSGRFVSAGLVAGPTGFANVPPLAIDALCEDVDGDGDLDLVQRTRSSTAGGGPKSAWWANDGSGHFTWRETFPGMVVMAVADLDGNSNPDLIALTTAPGSSYPLRWLPALGGGAFASWLDIASSSGTRFWIDEIAVADVDADGDLDVLAPSYSPRQLNLYASNGAGQFFPTIPSTLVLLGGSDTPQTVAAGDLNGDGLVDLAFGPLALVPTGVAVLHRRSTNDGWDAAIVQTVFDANSSHTGTSHFTLADPDGDGDQDLLCNRFVHGTRHQGDAGGHRQQVHDGLAGQGGITPLFGVTGPFRVGEQAQLRVRGLRPGASGRMVASYVSDPVPPGFGPMQAATPHRILSILPFTASGTAADPAGSGTWSLDYTVPGYSAGRTKMYVALVEDDGATTGEARSNRLYVTYGP